MQAGRGDLQVISISVAGEAALKQVHGLERDSNGVVVRVGGVAEGVGALIIHNRRLGGDGKHGGGFLSHQIPVAGCKALPLVTVVPVVTSTTAPELNVTCIPPASNRTPVPVEPVRASPAFRRVSIHVAAPPSEGAASPVQQRWSEASSFTSTRWSTASVKVPVR